MPGVSLGCPRATLYLDCIPWRSASIRSQAQWRDLWAEIETYRWLSRTKSSLRPSFIVSRQRWSMRKAMLAGLPFLSTAGMDSSCRRLSEKSISRPPLRGWVSMGSRGGCSFANSNVLGACGKSEYHVSFDVVEADSSVIYRKAGRMMLGQSLCNNTRGRQDRETMQRSLSHNHNVGLLT